MSALPFTAFNFAVEIVRNDGSAPLVSAAFSECDGLEIGMEVKTIREGGANDRQIRLAGPATVGQLTLKRGMTDESLDLWMWMNDSLADPSLRADAEVVLLAPDGRERMRFVLSRCLPAREGQGATTQRQGWRHRHRRAADRLRTHPGQTPRIRSLTWPSKPSHEHS